jgi:Skp family chaperone for outer membrane proteins
MRKSYLALAATALIALTAIPAPAAPNQPAPPQPAANDHQVAIGVVNVTTIYLAMKEPKKLTEAMRAQQEQLAKEQQQREGALNDMVKHRGEFKPGSAQFDAETKQIEDEQVKYQIWVATARAQLERQQKKNLKQIFDHIQQATREIAQQLHLNVVIADQSPEIGPDLNGINVQDLSQRLASRAVLYYDKKADITDEVLTRVEANYANGAGAAGAK